MRRLMRIGLSATLGDMRLAADFLRPGQGDHVHLIEDRSQHSELRVLVKGYAEPVVRRERDADGNSVPTDPIAPPHTTTSLAASAMTCSNFLRVASSATPRRSSPRLPMLMPADCVDRLVSDLAGSPFARPLPEWLPPVRRLRPPLGDRGAGRPPLPAWRPLDHGSSSGSRAAGVGVRESGVRESGCGCKSGGWADWRLQGRGADVDGSSDKK